MCIKQFNYIFRISYVWAWKEDKYKFFQPIPYLCIQHIDTQVCAPSNLFPLNDQVRKYTYNNTSIY